jgi:hypothetical protein
MDTDDKDLLTRLKHHLARDLNNIYFDNNHLISINSSIDRFIEKNTKENDTEYESKSTNNDINILISIDDKIYRIPEDLKTELKKRYPDKSDLDNIKQEILRYYEPIADMNQF